ncbi:MAG TPA: HAMP domain-containing sensor histidine kinase [Nitrososphaeraceae archaeon]|nr:HAMP domain-containing sensor histidine kinase [Nitrososphaeraceae archaeon]
MKKNQALTQIQNKVPVYTQCLLIGLWSNNMPTSDLSEVTRRQNVDLEREKSELTQLYSDLRESFEAMSEVNCKLRAVNEELRIRSKAQKEFINIAAHELRTPTQSIIGYCEMLQMFPGDSKEYLERLSRNADRLYTLISDLLEATSLEMGILKLFKVDFDLTDTIREVVSDIKKKPYIATKYDREVKIKPNIKLALKSHQIVVHADKERIVQVLSNLLDNAIKFTNFGTIMVSVNLDVNKIVKISVKDSGNGIDPEIRPKLFQKFSTLSNMGTGLGLFISKYIVEAHGGSISGKNNKPASGATFSFTLPTLTKKKDMSRKK